MQAKKVKRRQQIYVSVYVPERKKSVQVMVYSLPAYSLPKTVPDDMAQKMRDALAHLVPEGKAQEKTDEQVAKVQEWLDEQHALYERASLQRALHYVRHDMAAAAAALESGEELDDERADAIYREWDRLRKALRKAGHKAPKKGASKAPEVPEGQSRLDGL